MKKIYVIIRKSVVNNNTESVMIVSCGYTTLTDAQKKLMCERDTFYADWELRFGKKNFVLTQDERYFSVYRETEFGTSYIEENIETIPIYEKKTN